MIILNILGLSNHQLKWTTESPAKVSCTEKFCYLYYQKANIPLKIFRFKLVQIF